MVQHRPSGLRAVSVDRRCRQGQTQRDHGAHRATQYGAGNCRAARRPPAWIPVSAAQEGSARSSRLRTSRGIGWPFSCTAASGTGTKGVRTARCQRRGLASGRQSSRHRGPGPAKHRGLECSWLADAGCVGVRNREAGSGRSDAPSRIGGWQSQGCVRMKCIAAIRDPFFAKMDALADRGEFRVLDICAGAGGFSLVSSRPDTSWSAPLRAMRMQLRAMPQISTRIVSRKLLGPVCPTARFDRAEPDQCARRVRSRAGSQ